MKQKNVEARSMNRNSEHSGGWRTNEETYGLRSECWVIYFNNYKLIRDRVESEELTEEQRDKVKD